MKICIVLGTRPEIIKISPVIRECERLNLDYFILHTGQHYSCDTDQVLFEEMELPEESFKCRKVNEASERVIGWN